MRSDFQLSRMMTAFTCFRKCLHLRQQTPRYNQPHLGRRSGDNGSNAFLYWCKSKVIATWQSQYRLADGNGLTACRAKHLFSDDARTRFDAQSKLLTWRTAKAAAVEWLPAVSQSGSASTSVAFTMLGH